MSQQKNFKLFFFFFYWRHLIRRKDKWIETQIKRLEWLNIFCLLSSACLDNYKSRINIILKYQDIFEYIHFKQHSVSNWHLDFDEEMQRIYMKRCKWCICASYKTQYEDLVSQRIKKSMSLFSFRTELKLSAISGRKVLMLRLTNNILATNYISYSNILITEWDIQGDQSIYLIKDVKG